MSQAEPVWELHGEADAVVAGLVQMYPEKFGHIDPEVVGCAAITGKDKPDSQAWDAQIEGIKEPSALWSKKIYCIKFYKATWDSYNKNQREAMIFRNLVRIADECNGKILTEDLKDCYCLVKSFGLDYMKNPNLPSLLEQKQVFGDSNNRDNGV